MAASSGLTGPYPLDAATVDRIVTKTSPGAYALGRTDSTTYYISYVGRSDVDVNARLKQHAGKYAQFTFGYYATALAAFEKECHLFHDFSPGLDNDAHPARPQGSNARCPRCAIFG